MTEPLRIAITGASGSLGRHVVERLSSRPDTQLLALVRGASRPTALPESVRCQTVDFYTPSTVKAALEAFRPAAFVHCAADGMQVPRPGWSDLVQFNVNVSLQLLETTARFPGCRFVYVSSGLAYRDQGRALREDDPLEARHPYAASKAAADILLRAAAAELGVPLTVVRPFSFSGPGDSGTRLFPSLLRTAEQKRPLALSPGDQIRDHCAVADVAEGIALILARPGAPISNRLMSLDVQAGARVDAGSKPIENRRSGEAEIFNFGSGDPIPLRALIEQVVQELGLEVTLNFGARDYAPFEPKYLLADVSHARTALGWQPRTNFAYALWQLARESFPSLKLQQPRKTL